MQISTMLKDYEIRDCQQKLYEYFENGYLFEDFLGLYLPKIGLDEVEITQRSRDGGIDLKAVRKGIGDFGGLDTISYLVQAKRYEPSKKIGVQKIRELRGTLKEGNIGLFITTADFTDEAYDTAMDRSYKSVVTINGKKLVMSCIDNEIGFVFKPIFSSQQMDKFLDKQFKNKKSIQENTSAIIREPRIIGSVEKEITANDLRVHIISIPKSIFDKIGDNQERIDVIVNDDKSYNLKINRSRKYLSGVAQLHKEFGLVTDTGIIVPKICRWVYDESNKVVKLYIPVLHK